MLVWSLNLAIGPWNEMSNVSFVLLQSCYKPQKKGYGHQSNSFTSLRFWDMDKNISKWRPICFLKISDFYYLDLFGLLSCHYLYFKGMHCEEILSLAIYSRSTSNFHGLQSYRKPVPHWLPCIVLLHPKFVYLILRDKYSLLISTSGICWNFW